MGLMDGGIVDAAVADCSSARVTDTMRTHGEGRRARAAREECGDRPGRWRDVRSRAGVQGVVNAGGMLKRTAGSAARGGGQW